MVLNANETLWLDSIAHADEIDSLNMLSPSDPLTEGVQAYESGLKNYELHNHLGNVLTTITDRKLAVYDGGGDFEYYTAEVSSANDYYPFGMVMPDREYSNASYRYGFNGQELGVYQKG